LGQTIDPGAELIQPCGPTDTNCFVAVLGVDDEGLVLSGNLLRFNFVGGGVTATSSSGTITVTIPGVGGSLSMNTPTGSNPNGGTVSAGVLRLSFADGTNPGLVSIGAQTFAGAKSFTSPFQALSTTTLQGPLTVNSTSTFASAPVISPFSNGSVLYMQGNQIAESPNDFYFDGGNRHLGINTKDYIQNTGSLHNDITDNTRLTVHGGINNLLDASTLYEDKDIFLVSKPSDVTKNAGKGFISGQYLYVPDTGLSSITVLDANLYRKDTAPIESIASLSLPSRAPTALYNIGRYALVGTDQNELYIVDHASPKTLAVTSTTSGYCFDNASDIEVSGSYAYVSGLNGNISIINISDALNPTEVGCINIGSPVEDISISGKNLYAVSKEGNQFFAYDVSNITSPFLLNTVGIDSPLVVKSQSRYAYTLSSNGEFSTIDMVDSSNPSSVGGTNIGHPGVSFEIAGQYAYAVSSDKTMHVIDISFFKPRVIRNKNLESSANNILLSVESLLLLHMISLVSKQQLHLFTRFRRGHCT
jgi:hypothetical protein